MTDASLQAATLDQLRDLSAASLTAGVSALEPPSCLVLSASGPALTAPEARRLGDWLRQLPCPTLCIAGKAPSRAILRASDVVVRSVGEAHALAANIRRTPVAAAIFVQLLRSTEKMPIPDALFAESLAYATLQSGAEYRRWLKTHRAPAPAAPTDVGPPVVMARGGGVLIVELNRASNRNALNVELRDALVEALQLVLADTTIRRVKLRGRGKCFSTGGDLTEFGTVPDPAAGHAIRMLAMPGKFLAQCAERVEVHVHSACIGAGIELPAFARRVTAARDAFFQLPELSFGLMPGAGGTVSLPRRIGRQRTAWMVLSGKRVGVKKALEWGLIDAIDT